MILIKEFALEQQDQLIKQYAPLVHRIASQIHSRLPDHVLFDDIVQAGMIGLLSAIRKHDPSQGASLETYASIRIRGAILDEIRKDNWVSRRVHQQMRKMLKAIKEIEQTQSYADDQSIAQMMGMPITDFHSFLQELNANKLVALNEAEFFKMELDNELIEAPTTPQGEYHKEVVIEQLVNVLQSLPIRECLILALYYDEEMNLKEIAETVGLTEARVSQLHSQAMVRVKARMEAV